MNASWKSRKLATYLVARNEKAIPSGDVPLYSLTIENGVTAKTDRYNRDFLVKDMDSKTYKVVYPGDVVFNPANLRWGAIARSVVEHKVVISPIYEVLEIKKDIVDPELLTHAITCPRQIGIYATKTEGTLIERMAVKLDAFLFTEILLPETLEEQRKIAALLCTARKEIDLLKKQLEAYRQQKRGLMQKLLTGQWRVKINKGETN
jgi:type I restriction enzyme S subunit